MRISLEWPDGIGPDPYPDVREIGLEAWHAERLDRAKLDHLLGALRSMPGGPARASCQLSGLIAEGITVGFILDDMLARWRRDFEDLPSVAEPDVPLRDTARATLARLIEWLASLSAGCDRGVAALMRLRKAFFAASPPSVAGLDAMIAEFKAEALALAEDAT